MVSLWEVELDRFLASFPAVARFAVFILRVGRGFLGHVSPDTGEEMSIGRKISGFGETQAAQGAVVFAQTELQDRLGVAAMLALYVGFPVRPAGETCGLPT
jgi:hypothetical protein